MLCFDLHAANRPDGRCLSPTPTYASLLISSERSEDLRKDAERNRQKLIVAASEMMRNKGGDVPMEVIAERASLTRGTLYRNFAHR